MSDEGENWKTALVRRSYEDGAKPTVKAVGDALGSVAKLIMSPFKLIADLGNAGMARLTSRLEGKMEERVPPERRIEPSAQVAGPAVMHYLLLGEGGDTAELRELFENLLLASMDSDTASSAHPAFVGMLSQMTREEAWVLKSIDRDRYYAVDVFRATENELGEALGVHSLLGIEVVEDPQARLRCISNLDRLGILRITMASSGAYDQQDQVGAYVDKLYGGGTFGHAGLIEVTPLGRQFLNTCVRAH